MENRVDLPDKLFFKIGEVAKLAAVKQHVLRYWESEFPSIRPQKSKTNQRLYRRKDVEAVMAIKHLLYDRKFTIEGARRHLKGESVESSLPPRDPDAVAKVARDKALEDLDMVVANAKGRTADKYDELLLELSTMAKTFLKELQEIDEDK